MMPYWSQSGHQHLERTESGHARITAAYLRCFFERPEFALVESSCQQERRLHAALVDDPGRPVSEHVLAAVNDPDARENYRFGLAFRDLLLSHETLESAYLALVCGRAGEGIPKPFADLMVEAIVAGLLAEDSDPYLWRAAELLFRVQKVSIGQGVLLADAEVLERRRSPSGVTALQLLVREAQGHGAGPDDALDVLNDANAHRYASRNQQRDFVLDIRHGERGLDSLCRLLERWLQHFLGLRGRIQALRAIDDDHWTWHIGLDAESNCILNDLYHGHALDEGTLRRLLALFQLELESTDRVEASAAGRPVYLGIAMNEQGLLVMKPQNLLTNLPLQPGTTDA